MTPDKEETCKRIAREIYNNPGLDKVEMIFSEAKRLHEDYGWDEDDLKRLILRAFVDCFDERRNIS